jgi:hypothetical protein
MLCLIFVSPNFEARKFCLKFALKTALSLGILPVRKPHTHTDKYTFFPVYIGRYKNKFFEKYKSALRFAKNFNTSAQAQQLFGLVLSA